MVLTLEKLRQIYPEQLWIDLSTDRQLPVKLPITERASDDLALSQVDFNRLCATVLTDWLSQNIGTFAIKSTFPCAVNGVLRLEFIAKLVNGFALQLGETKVVFIPSQSIDLTEFEVPQEWVDLPNWAADYYIPVRVDLDRQYLQLWGFISHRALIATAEFDRVFRNYQIAGADTMANLAEFFAACELNTIAELTAARSSLEQIPTLAPAAAITEIDRLQQHRSIFSPRLDLPFSQWGALLNEAKWLERYAIGRPQETQLSRWRDRLATAICDGWSTVEHFIDPPQLSPVRHLRAHHLESRLRPQKIRGMSLTTTAEIAAAIAHLYESQSAIAKPDRILGVEDLVRLLQLSPLETIRWKAAEYLWIIDERHPALPIRRILDLGMRFQGEEIALMVSMMEKPDRRMAILIQLYATGSDRDCLPPGLELALQDERGETVLDSAGHPFIATARSESPDARIQLYFVADRADRFGACITLDETQIVEEFRV